MKNEIQIEPTWKLALKSAFSQDYFIQLAIKLREFKQAGRIIYPKGSLIFNAFNLTPLPSVKVVILGQDPYHNPGEAMGLSFSVPKGIRVPPSLKNIFKELLNNDVGFIESPSHGDLTVWANQGVLLLNAMLTVEKNKPGSHKNIGWQDFTDDVLRTISDKMEGIVFMLWGNFAKSKSKLINHSKHLVLEAAHPSPLAGGAFFGCQHFKKANEYLNQNGKPGINWSITD